MRCKPFLNFVCHNTTSVRDKRRKNRCVVAGSRAYVQNDFPRLWVDGAKASRMKTRFAIIAGAFPIKCDDYVLVQERQIAGWCVDVPEGRQHFPGTAFDKALPWNGRECRCEPLSYVWESTLGCDVAGIKVPNIRQARLHFKPL